MATFGTSSTPLSCYAMSGTHVAYGATCYAIPVLTQRMVLRLCYVMSGTDTAYGAMRVCSYGSPARFPVLSYEHAPTKSPY
eukprot:297841-Rhodomonas_salina.9